MEFPVYLFTGFLESGKTSFLQESLEDEYFNSGENTLVLLCEEGTEELDRAKFAAENIFIEVIENQAQLSKKRLKALARICRADRVIVEYNGMWEIQTFVDNMPKEWLICQNMMFADASTFMNYNANMRNLVADKLKFCDAVVFNRFRDDMDKMEFHKLVRTFNRRADIFYEFAPDRVEADEFADPLPYDMEAPVICIEDEDYAVWYRDVNEETQNYIDKTVKLKGRIVQDNRLPEGDFIFGRHVMTCCVEDIEFCAVACHMQAEQAGELKKFKHGQWLCVTGVVSESIHRFYNGEAGPIINITEIEPTEKPEDEVAVFY